MKWITRARPVIDRIACPWLIARFIDAAPEFLFTPPEDVIRQAEETGATPFDVPGVAFGHAGDKCSFDAFVTHYGLQSDPAIVALADIVRGADTSRLDLTPQSAGLLAISKGLREVTPDDHDLLKRGFVIYDALYAWAGGKSATHIRLRPKEGAVAVSQVLNSPAVEGHGLFSPVSSLYAARALRDFGDGFVAVLLPVYLSALGLGAFEIGVVATTALFGSALMTLAIGFLGHRIDRRTLLIAASGLMVATGFAFTQSASYGAVLLVAFCGTINPSSGSVSIFVPIEHATLSHLVADKARTSAFARYSLVGALAAAVGALAAMSPDLMAEFGISRLGALEAMFTLYALLGVAGGLFYARIPRASATEDKPAAALGPSRGIVYRLAALFSIDAFAGGLAVQSLLALWLFTRFGLSLAEAGTFFFISGVLSAFSFPVAAWLARRIGLVNTMVFTHIPSSLCLIGAAVVPSLEAALVLLLARSALSQMDVPTRSSYVMAVVTPPERAAAASITSVPRSLAAALSPAMAGALFAAGHEAWPFILCGVLKILYDFGLLWAFRHIKPPEER